MSPLDGGKALLVTDGGVMRFSPEEALAGDVPFDQTIGHVNKIFKLPDGQTLIGATGGLFRVDTSASSGKKTEGEASAGSVSLIKTDESGRVLIGTTTGLFEFSKETSQLLSIPPVGGVSSLDAVQYGWTMVKTETGYFLLAPGAHQMVKADAIDLSVTQLVTTSQQAFFTTTSAQLFVLHKDSSKLTLIDKKDLAGLRDAVALSSGSIVLSAMNGLYLIAPNGEFVNRVAPMEDLGDISRLYRLGDGRVVFQKFTGELKVISTSGIIENVSAGVAAGQLFNVKPMEDGRSLLLMHDGLFIVEGGFNELKPVLFQGKPIVKWPHGMQFPTLSTLPDKRVLVYASGTAFIVTPGSNVVIKAGDSQLFGDLWRSEENWGDYGTLLMTDTGAFRLPYGGTSFEAAAGPELSRKSGLAFYRNFPEAKILALGRSISSVATDDFANAVVTFSPTSPYSVDKLIDITATVKSGQCETMSSLWKPRLRIVGSGDDGGAPVYVQSSASDGNRLYYSYTFQKAGDYKLQLEFPSNKNTLGRASAIHAGTSFDSVVWWTKFGGIVLLVGHLLAVSILAFRARYSRTSFQILMDPVWGTVAVYFNSALRHSRLLQLWLLDRYVQEAVSRARKGIQEPFEPMIVTGPDGQITEGDGKLLAELRQRRHVWVQGPTGMGKSTMFRAIERNYFMGEDGAAITAFAAYRKWGAVLLFVSARRFESIASDANAPEQWLTKVSLEQLSHYGLPFSDVGTVRAMLDLGTLGIVIDGVNEVGKDQQVAAFAQVSPATPVLATSQTDAKEPFGRYLLPETIQDYVGKLLRAHLGERIGLLIEKGLRERAPELLAALRSGYDVKLVIDLVRQSSISDCSSEPNDILTLAVNAAIKKLPMSRIGLYDAMLAKAEPGYLMDDLGTVAWQMWMDGKRELPVDDSTNEKLIIPLERRDLKILRRVANGRYEFRHDQMRSYVAALWLVAQALNIETLSLHLANPKVWLASARDQVELWSFVAMLTPVGLLSSFWVFASATPERARLQHALQLEAAARHLDLFTVVNVPKKN